MASLTCLRCGEEAVIVPFWFMVSNRGTFDCRNCQTLHFLEVEANDNHFFIIYDRYTMRFPLEFYDSGETPIISKLRSSSACKNTGFDDVFSGPWVIYPRKRYYSKDDIKQIWGNSLGACHLCNRKWKIEERGLKGWHIDHIIPNAGGGNTENIKNMKVACAKCNLKKGRGYTETVLRVSIRNFLGTYFQWKSSVRLKIF